MKKFFILLFAISINFAFGQIQNGVKHIPTEQTEEIYDEVENIAQFPGGINAFRTEIMNNFRSDKIAGTGKISTEITFVIERDGKIDNIKVRGNNASLNSEAVRAIKKIKQTWTPRKSRRCSCKIQI